MTSTPAKKSGDGADMRQMLAEVEARRASAMDEARPRAVARQRADVYSVGVVPNCFRKLRPRCDCEL